MVGVVAWGLSLLLAATSLVEVSELALVDLRLGLLPRTPLDDRIRLVVVDRDSQQELGRWPWSRQIHARLVERLTAAGARTLVFDISFAHKTDQDAALARAMKRSGNTLCAVSFERAGDGSLFTDELPPELVEASVELVTPEVHPDRDGVLRRAALVNSRSRNKPLARSAVEAFLGEEYQLSVPMLGNQASLGRPLPVWGGPNWLLLDYPTEVTRRMVSYHRVLAAEDLSQFAGKLVLIGSISDFNDFVRAPVEVPLAARDGEIRQAGSRRIPGVVYHAAVCHTLLSGDPVSYQEGRWDPLFRRLLNSDGWTGGHGVGTLLALLLSAFFYSLERKKATLASLLVLLLWVLYVWFGLLSRRQMLPLAMPMLTGSAVLLGQLLYGTRQLRSLLTRFMPGADIESLAARPELTEQRRRVEEVTVVFVDLRDYTTLTEKLGVERAPALMRQFHAILGKVLAEHGGYVCDFQGDAQMAVFGLEGRRGHAQNAMRAAISLKRALEQLQSEELPAGLRLRYAVGICSGPVSVGYLEGGGKLQYTVLGDTTNVASRLQGLSKTLCASDTPSAIVVSRSTVEQFDQAWSLREVGPVPLKGKREPHHVYVWEENA